MTYYTGSCSPSDRFTSGVFVKVAIDDLLQLLEFLEVGLYFHGGYGLHLHEGGAREGDVCFSIALGGWGRKPGGRGRFRCCDLPHGIKVAYIV